MSLVFVTCHSYVSVALLHWLSLTFVVAIGNAFAVLSDQQKRKRYDEFGTDEAEPRRRSRADGYEYDFSRGFEGACFICSLLCVLG